MEFIWMLIIGLIAGAIAKAIMPGKDPGGIIITMLLGVAGAFLGGFLFRSLGFGDGEGLSYLIGAVIGALILLFLYRLFTRRRGGGTRPVV